MCIRDRSYTLAASLQELISGQTDCRLFIDIPIGLADGHKRDCDQMVRRLLSPLRHTSVFSTPVRDAVYAPDYDTACNINAKQTGNRISKQSWNICPKIREVDEYLREHPGLQNRVYESHPEVAFYALNGLQSLPTQKKSNEGQAQRLALLEQHIDNARRLFSDAAGDYPRSQVQCDDILDAMVLAIMASGNDTGLVSVPEPTPRDRYGLPMRIVYRSV